MRSWNLVENESRLVSGKNVAQLTPKAAAVLGCLIRNKGATVSREAILAEVWPGLHVTPDLVREYIFDLRSVLNDDAKAPIYIETIRGKGFRLIGDIQMAPGNEQRKGTAVRATIAVLRPESFNEDSQWQLFADILTEDITTDLARFPDLAVVARHSSFAIEKHSDLREAASHLGATYLLESSIAVRDSALRAHFQLIDGKSGTHVWAERVERDMSTAPGLSGEIAEAVANTLGGLQGEIHRAERLLVRRKHLADLSAYEHYIVACEKEHHFDPESHRVALDHVNQSITLEPNFARSWLIRYFVSLRAANLLPEKDPAAWREEAKQSIRRAFELDPRDALTMVNFGMTMARDGDVAGSIDLISRAADLARNQADAAAMSGSAFATVVGDNERAAGLLETAFRLNPTPPGWYGFARARVAYFAGDYECCERSTQSAPDYVAALVFRCLAQAMLGRAQEASVTLHSLLQKFPRFDFEDYASALPIVSPKAIELYRAGIERLARIDAELISA